MRDKKKITIVVVICVVVVLILSGVAGFLLFSKHQRETSTVTVNLDIQIQDYEAQTGSGVPVRVDGTDYKGSPVSEMFLVDGNISGVELHNGNYELRVAGSPVNGSGGIYEVPTKTYVIQVDGDDVVIDGEQRHVELGGDRTALLPRMDFNLIEPDSISDAQIVAIRTWMQEFGLSAGRIDEFVSLIQQSKADAVKKKEAAALEAWRTKLSGNFIGNGTAAPTGAVSVVFDGSKVTVTGSLKYQDNSGSAGANLSGNEWHFLLTDNTEYGSIAEDFRPDSKESFQNTFLSGRFPSIRISVQDGYVTRIVVTS